MSREQELRFVGRLLVGLMLSLALMFALLPWVVAS